MKLLKLIFKPLIWLISTVLSVFITPAQATTTYNENYFTKQLVEQFGFKAGNTLSNKLRPDLYLDEYVIEVDWTTKKYEAIGQALVYSYYTKKKPAIVFLNAGTELDPRIIEVLNSNKIKYWTYTVDKITGEIRKD